MVATKQAQTQSEAYIHNLNLFPFPVGFLNTINGLRPKWPAKKVAMVWGDGIAYKSLCINYEQGRQINAINYRTDIAKSVLRMQSDAFPHAFLCIISEFLPLFECREKLHPLVNIYIQTLEYIYKLNFLKHKAHPHT